MKVWGYCLCAFLYTLEAQALRSNEDWTGFYLGTKMGAALDQFDLTTSVQPSIFLNPAKAEVGQKIRTKILKS